METHKNSMMSNGLKLLQVNPDREAITLVRFVSAIEDQLIRNFRKQRAETRSTKGKNFGILREYRWRDEKGEIHSMIKTER